MRAQIFLILIISLQIQSRILAATNVSGDQSGTWTLANSPYVLVGNVTVPSGKTLTIAAGVEVQFPSTSSNSQLIVQGTLKAIGTSSNFIKFSGGSLGGGQLRGPVVIEATSTNSILQYITIDGLGYYYYSDFTAAIIVRSSSCSVKNCTIQNIRGTAVQLDNAAPLISNNTFASNSNYDVILGVDNLPKLTGNNALKIGLTSSTMTKSDNLPAGNLYYSLLANLVVPQGKTLTVVAGVELYFPSTGSNSQLIVQGTLKAIGTSSNFIKFSGGGLGGDQLRGPVVIEATSTNSVLQYITIDGLGYYYNSDFTAAIIVRSSSCSIKNCTIQNIRGSAVQLDNAAPQISNNTFASNANYDVILGVDNLPKLTGNNALKIGLTSSTMTKSDDLPAGNLYYSLLSNLVVPQGKTLTVAAGVELYFPSTGSNSQLIIQGTLKAVGTSSNFIKFSGGGLGGGQLRGPVVIEATSTNSVLQYITIDGLGYYYNSDYTAAIIVRSSSCSIKNCTIQNIRGSAVQLDNAAPQISNNTFASNANYDAILGVDNLPKLTGNNALKIGLTSSTMTKNDNLPAGNLYYSLLANLVVPQGKILTIAAGVELYFPSTGSNSQLIVQGTLKAVGTSSNFIKFSGGGLGGGQLRGPVVIESTSSNSALQNITVDGLGYYYSSFTTGILVVRSSSCTIKNCSFLNSHGSAVLLDNAAPTMTNNIFSGTQYADIYGNALSFENASGNNAAKVYVAASAVSKNTTWPLQGSSGSKYVLLGTITVNKNFSLTITPGATVDFNNNNGNIMVDGTLKAVGTKTARIQFVKQNTDASWGGTVSFNSSGKNSKLSFVNIDKLGSTASPALGAAVAINTNAVAIDNIVVSNSQNTGMMINNVNPLIVQSSFLANKDGVLSTGGKANFVQCTFQGNTGYGIKNVSTKGTDKIDARYCWWGTAKGPRIATNPGGNGDSVSTKVLYSPFQAVKNELYLPVLDSTRLSDSLACPGSNIIVSVKATGVFGEGNVFTAELSNASGDFTNPVTIGSVTESSTGNLAAVDVNAVLPASVKGKNYKIRLTSSAPAAVSDAVSIIPTNCNGITSENISAVSKLPDAGFKIIAYPNPTANTATLTIDGVRGKTAMISISDLSGRMLWQGKAVAGDRVSLPVEKYATGTYIITVVCDNETKVVKLVKN